MSDPLVTSQSKTLEPVHADAGYRRAWSWSERLVLLLRVMAGLALLKGLYHWAVVCGLVGEESFEVYAVPYQTATVFFAVIDLVAAVGLWLAAPWGAVVWLTAVISMIAIEMIFPQVYGGSIWTLAVGVGCLGVYLLLALKAAGEQPH